MKTEVAVLGAGELIAEGALAVETAASVAMWANVFVAHPTLSEMLMASAESIFAQATHFCRRQRRT